MVAEVTDRFWRRALRALDEFWTPQPLSPRMQQELRQIAHNDDVATRLLREHETARRKVKTRQRWLFGLYCTATVSAGIFLAALILLRLRPDTSLFAVGVLVGLLVTGSAYLVLGVLSWPTRTRRDASLCITSAAAAGRCSNAVAEGADLAWRRRIAGSIAETAEDFARRHRKRWYAPASGTPLNIITTRLAQECTRAIRTLVERTLMTDDLAELRDDLWRLHMRVMAADFGGVLALQHHGVAERSQVGEGLPTWRQVLVVYPCSSRRSWPLST